MTRCLAFGSISRSRLAPLALALGGTPAGLAEVLLLLRLCGNCSTNPGDSRWRRRRRRRREASLTATHPYGSGLPWPPMLFNLLGMRSVSIDALHGPTRTSLLPPRRAASPTTNAASNKRFLIYTFVCVPCNFWPVWFNCLVTPGPEATL